MINPFSVDSLINNYHWTLIPKIQHSIRLIRVALGNSPNQTAICFNGGKDSTVLLDLVSQVCRLDQLPLCLLLYFDSQDEFPEVTKFINETVDRYSEISGRSLTICRYFNTKDRSMKEELWRFHREHPEIKNVLLGCRQDDPNPPLQDYQMTDPNWPPLLRFYPLRTWKYSDIWNYLTISTHNEKIRLPRIPYCSLYDQGFTSIGNSKTQRNIWLKINSDDLQESYYPAWMLTSLCPENEQSERIGRH